MPRQNPRFRIFFEQTTPWLLLAFLVLYSHVRFVQTPYVGFRFEPDGLISDVFIDADPDATVHMGDRLVRVGALQFADFRNDLRQTLFASVQPGQTVELAVEREGELLSFSWVFPGQSRDEILERLNSRWWFGYVFWLAGTATLYLVRPRDARWRLLIAFNYLTAIWLETVVPAGHHILESAFLFRSAVWLSLPVYLHLHWVFPTPVSQRRPLVIWGLYLFATVMTALEWLELLPIRTYAFGLLGGILGSVILLVVRVIFRAHERRDVRPLATATSLIFLPPIVVSIATVLGFPPPPFIEGGAFLALPALPGAYFLVAYRRQLRGLENRTSRLSYRYLALVVLGVAAILLISVLNPRLDALDTSLSIGVSFAILGLIVLTSTVAPFLVLPALAGSTYSSRIEGRSTEIRANRVLTPFLFFVTLGTLASILAFFGFALLDFPGENLLVIVGIVFLISLAFTFGYAPFERFVEHNILGMPLKPATLLETYATRITTSLDTTSLINLLQDEVLPTMLIRQSALLAVSEDNKTRTLLSVGVAPEDPPNAEDLLGILQQVGEYRPPPSDASSSMPVAWVRLVLPLKLGNQLNGLWLLGRRDPDDFYSLAEIHTLQALAQQTAIALANIDQGAHLAALLQANIGRHDAERNSLAQELHDDVLNELAAMRMTIELERDAIAFDAIYERVTERLRRIATGMRPPMLIYGLWSALEDMVTDLAEREAVNPTILLEIPESRIRYPKSIELHLYRIVQQACENTLHHAAASTLQLRGQLDEAGVSLVVKDDGAGFEIGKDMGLHDFVVHKHFGLAGMLERAEIIGAKLQVDSEPGGGTRVLVNWRPQVDDQYQL